MKALRILRAILVLALIFLWDLVVASFTVARIVLSPHIRTTPAIIAVPVAVKQPWAVALFAYFTSLTPGSTCLHVSEDRSLLYLHILNSRDGEATARRFKQHYERWIQELEA